MQPNRRPLRRIALALACLAIAPLSLGTVGSSGDSCDDATFEVTALPFADAGDTTGSDDDLDLSLETELCVGGGNQFPGTGTGPDTIYRFQVDVICEVEITLTPDPAVDLSLYAVGSCESESLAATCQGVSDDGVEGVSESIRFRAIPLTVYFVVVDGYDGAAGGYSLNADEITDTGCSLIPVELQNFTVE